MASGTITPNRPRFYRIVENGQTYSFDLELTDTARFRGGILIQENNVKPPVWIFAVGTGETPTVNSYKFSIDNGTSDITISSVAMSGTTLSVTFNRMTYGGVMLIWFD